MTGLAARLNILLWGPGDFPAVSYSNKIHHETLKIVIQEVVWSIRGSYSAIWSFPLGNVKWHYDSLAVTGISKPIRLSTNLLTLIPSLTFIELCVFFIEHLQRIWHVSRERVPFQTPFCDLLMLQLLWSDFQNSPCLYSTFQLEHPSALSRFCFLT